MTDMIKRACGFLLLVTGIVQSQALVVSSPPPPPPVVSVSSLTGKSGLNSYYYWVVARYAGGAVNSQNQALVINVAAVSGADRIQVNWNNTGAATYDVIRGISPNFPGSCTACVVGSGIVGTTLVDQGNALTNYTMPPLANSASATINLDTLNHLPPAMIASAPMIVPELCFSTDGSCQVTAGGGGGGTGPAGPTGPQGPQGNLILSGSGTPSTQGANGDYYINTATSVLFGPKSGGVWPGSGITLIGPTGANGANGTSGVDGKSMLNGTVNPTGGVGNNGDFYINTAANTLFGPKASGTWPSGVSIIGAAGATGANGANGAAGANGAPGGNAKYIVAMSGTSVTVLGTTHHLGALVSVEQPCKDVSGNSYEPGGVSVNGSGDVVITSNAANTMSGTCILLGTPVYQATLTGDSTAIAATTHNLGVTPVLSACYTSTGNQFFVGSFGFDGSGNATIVLGTGTYAAGDTCLLR